jgi:endoglucanase
MKFRKFTALFLIIALILSAAACRSAPTDSDGEDTRPLHTIDPDCTIVNPPATRPILPPAEYIPFPGYDPLAHEMREITVGWNLGNTFDAPRGETSWGNPITSFTMINAVAEAGFDAVRLPITWQMHMGEAPDYTIDSAWLSRVEEVVGYVLAAGMYCIINTHHEGWIFPVEEQEEQIALQLAALWTQISLHFAEYNEKLIFEGMNEPRLFNTEHEWNGGTAEAHRVVNRLNEVFIDTVRATGGRNILRHLMIPTYAASAEPVAVAAVANTFPHDDGKVIVSIHAYTPTNFALNPQGTGNWLAHRQEEEINWMFNRLESYFLDENIPVIMGETGAVNKDNLPERIAWATYYFAKAKELGIPAFWWDNGIFEARSETSELFGFLNRHYAVFMFPEILEAIIVS